MKKLFAIVMFTVFAIAAGASQTFATANDAQAISVQSTSATEHTGADTQVFDPVCTPAYVARAADCKDLFGALGALDHVPLPATRTRPTTFTRSTTTAAINARTSSLFTDFFPMDFCARDPITLASAREVAEVLREVPASQERYCATSASSCW